ncbi:hypothetical protein, partial [Micromonospora sp. WMMD736]|uniref:hypothetical protein n=1 Tax=Micromonospora sp. WMMD736 TaxID=3404112 RepID=UPI003B940326
LDDDVKLTAAISTHFDPLKVLGTESLIDDRRVEQIDGLAAVCDEVEVAGSEYRHWSMRTEARHHVLKTIAAQPDIGRRLNEIEVAPDDNFARYLSDGLRGADLSVLIQPSATSAVAGGIELDCLLRAVRVLKDLPDLPTVTRDLERKVRRKIALTESEKMLQAVVPPKLVGREDDYAALADYCSTTLETGGDWVRSFGLIGLGGVGKSALVSKFVSDRRQAGSAPLIYFDFDRASLIEATRLDLTFEFTRQLGLAEAALEQPLSELRQRSRALLGGRENDDIDIGAGASSDALRDLALLLSSWPLRTAPVTLVLDTFEEVAIRGVTAVRDILEWVAELRNIVQLSQIHLIVSGREVIPDAPYLPAAEVEGWFNFEQKRELGDLGTDEAAELLTELGVEPPLATRFPPVFGGNPLVLKLIQRFVTTNDPAEVEKLIEDGIAAHGHAPAGEVGLRFVYERILNRIKNDRVKALAYPGIVLRRVTPELILEVLVPTCRNRLDVTTPADAQRAFAELAEHVWLVTRVGPDAVVHRADLRRLLVPGLERSTDIDTEAIHRAAATYYAARRDSANPDITKAARVEEIYHRGFLDDIPADMAAGEADELVRSIAGDLQNWPVHPRATVKAVAGRHDQLTEEEVASLDFEQQIRTRDVRLGKYHASSDIDSATFEETQLGQLQGYPDAPTAAIPESRWALLFDRGDFQFISKSSRVLSAFDGFFTAGRSSYGGLLSNPTHRHPWFIALAVLMVEHGGRPIFSDAALDALDVGAAEFRRYGAALAALAGDQRAHHRIIKQVRAEMPPRLDLKTVDDIVVCQAAASGGDLDGSDTRFQTFWCDQFRLSHLAAIAANAHDRALTDSIIETTDRYLARRPDTADLNRFRATLAREPLSLGGAKELLAAPTTLSFWYGAVRTVVEQLNRTQLLEVVRELEQRSVFWPVDLTADPLSTTLRTAITATELTALIETADRCGLLIDLVEAASSRATTNLSLQLASGIRRIEGLLFPLAKPHAELPR